LTFCFYLFPSYFRLLATTPSPPPPSPLKEEKPSHSEKFVFKNTPTFFSTFTNDSFRKLDLNSKAYYFLLLLLLLLLLLFLGHTVGTFLLAMRQLGEFFDVRIPGKAMRAAGCWWMLLLLFSWV
jgi:hypothetical protein